MRSIGWVKGELMYLNTVVLRFNIERGDVTELVVYREDLLPYEFRMTKPKRALLFWLDDRVLPETRIGLSDALKKAGIPYFSMDLILHYTNAFSLEDYNWVRFEDGVQSWEEMIHAKFDGVEIYAKDRARLLALTEG